MRGLKVPDITVHPDMPPEFREPHWRWQHANLKAAGDKTFQNVEDEWVLKAAAYLRDVSKASNSSVPKIIFEKYTDVYSAHRINALAEGNRLMSYIEALILIGESAEEITALCGLTHVETAEAYEKLFFDMRDLATKGAFAKWKLFSMYAPDVHNTYDMRLKYLAICVGADETRAEISAGINNPIDLMAQDRKIYQKGLSSKTSRAVFNLDPNRPADREQLFMAYNSMAQQELVSGIASNQAIRVQTELEQLTLDKVIQMTISPVDRQWVHGGEPRTGTLIEAVQARMLGGGEGSEQETN